MPPITLKLTGMANGGLALGRDNNERVIFVPGAIPGEVVQVEITQDKKRYAHARLLKIVEPSPQRVEPVCPHFGPCGVCHFQHLRYEAQLGFKGAVLKDQLERIGGIEDVDIQPVLANPDPWNYAIESTFYQASDGRLGYWSPENGDVLVVDSCPIIGRPLLDLYHDIDISLPGLRKMTLRMGMDESLLAALTTDNDEPPLLEVDFPVSAAIVLEDGTAANLVGDNFIYQEVGGRLFRVSAGCFFYRSIGATNLLIDTVLKSAEVAQSDVLLELYAGVGTLTAFLAPLVAEVIAIESNPDAVADAALNLDHLDNVSLYEGNVEKILPLLKLTPDIVVADPPPVGFPPFLIDELARLKPGKLIYISSDVASFSRDCRRLKDQGFRLQTIQPIDLAPQTYHLLMVSSWRPA